MQKPITVIDLGSNRIVAATAGIGKKGGVTLLAMENLHSRGINEGEITDISKAVEDISLITGKLKEKCGRKPKNVFVTTRSADIEVRPSRGMIPLSKTSREITRNDVRRSSELASMVRLSLDRAIVQKIVRNFRIDENAAEVKNPVGLYGMRLEVESFIVTANRSKIQNITKCIDHAGFLLGGVYLSSIASAESVLDSKEKEKGVLLLDIGEALTEGLIFKNDMLKNFCAIRKGARAVYDGNRHVDKPGLTALLLDTLAALPNGASAFSSVVLTGGGALLDGVIEEAEKVFKLPVKIGLAKNQNQSLNSQDAIIHAPTIGLITHIANDYKASQIHTSPFLRTLHNLQHIYETYF
ncbi:MAG: hypothetical protein NG740_01165 [Omnitrophica bacterium]|nr:hypothetical protein [Candidatus Omnitrophota bacterium]